MKRLQPPFDPKAYFLLDGFISGGSFRAYLESAVQSCTKPVCLCLKQVAYGFRLPCPDGQGELLSAGFTGGQFSDLLCAYFLWGDGQPYNAILYDNVESIRKKLEIAEAYGVKYCFIEQ